MVGKKSASKARVRRVPMREFSRSLPMSLLRAREAVMRHFRASLRNHGLTEQQWRILRALASVDTIEVTELARVAFLLGPSLSRILRDLEARRLIERKVAKADLRRGVVSISAKGVRLIEAVAPSSEVIYAAITRRYGRWWGRCVMSRRPSRMQAGSWCAWILAQGKQMRSVNGFRGFLRCFSSIQMLEFLGIGCA